jgi:hypothetical protein
LTESVVVDALLERDKGTGGDIERDGEREMEKEEEQWKRMRKKKGERERERGGTHLICPLLSGRNGANNGGAAVATQRALQDAGQHCITVRHVLSSIARTQFAYHGSQC